MSHVTKLRGEPVENGDILVDFRGDRWKYRYTTHGVDDDRICVEPAKHGKTGARMFFPSVFPGLSVEEA